MAAWTVNAAPYPDLPGSAQVTVTGPPLTSFALERSDPTSGRRVPVRVGSPATDVGGVWYGVDPEAPIGQPATYTIITGNSDIVTSGPVTVPPPPGGGALLRSVLRPWVDWMQVVVIAETDLNHDTSTTAIPIIGSPDLVVVGDVRRRRSGKFTFAFPNITETDKALTILRDGVPILIRFCPGGATKARDCLFYAQQVTETRQANSTRRYLLVDYQSVDWVEGATETPPPRPVTYTSLAAVGTYRDVTAAAATYRDVLLLGG